MMKGSIIVFVVILVAMQFAFGQSEEIEDLKRQLSAADQDTLKVRLLYQLSRQSRIQDPISGISYGEQALALGESSDFHLLDGQINRTIGICYRLMGDTPKALEYSFRALEIAEATNDQRLMGRCENAIAIVYSQLNDQPMVIKFQKRAIRNFQASGEFDLEINSHVNLGRSYRKHNLLDSAKMQFDKAYAELDQFRNQGRHAFLFLEMGTLFYQQGKTEEAFVYLWRSIKIAEKINYYLYTSFAYQVLAEIYKEQNNFDSCVYYAKKAVADSKLIDEKYNRLEALDLLVAQYESKDLKEAYQYSKEADEIRTHLYGPERLNELQTIFFEEQERQRQIEKDRISFENQVKQYGLLVGILFFLIIAVVLYRNNRIKHKANAMLQTQKEKVEETLAQLKATQTQLVHTEKMASLGELTAGIAHEIQNPLNFVNNFSEVNSELIEELRQELEKGDLDEARTIARDIEENEQKIKHHGQRAESIVKGMLQHSRTNSGEKVLTDINKLADEYLRLAYHGMRAKDKSFNAEFKTEFDPDLPKVNVVPQDIGRVLLNLINNAFYAVSEASAKESAVSSKAALSSSKGAKESSSYKPEVTVSTKILPLAPLPDRQAGSRGGQQLIEISVKDNGLGILKAARDKIFQPFFTTKPTGEGTGLGLSLSYDIITKGHNGKLEVETEEGVGTRFYIKLPIV